MHWKAADRPFRPALETLEGRDLPSALPGLAQSFLQPLAQQEAAASSSSLTRLQAADAALADIQSGKNLTATSDQSAILYAQAASAYQDVLTERRTLELSFLSILDFFGSAIQTGGDVINDTNQFVNVIEPALNVSRQKVIDNETAANKLAIVTTGVNTAPGANGQFVNAISAINNANPTVPIEINYPPLLPSKGFKVVTAPQFDYSQALWPLAYGGPGNPNGYVPPTNNP